MVLIQYFVTALQCPEARSLKLNNADYQKISVVEVQPAKNKSEQSYRQELTALK